MGLIARLSRTVPLVIILAVIAVIVYLVVSYKRSPNHAKEVLIRSFTWLTGALCVFFGIVSLYALVESNDAVLDLSASFLAVSAVGLAITRWCNHVFLKHNPTYRRKPSKASIKNRFPWKR